MKKKISCILKSILLALFVIVFPVFSGIIITINSIKTPQAMYIQIAFMLIPLVVAIIVLIFKRIKFNDINLVFIKDKMNYLYLIPSIIIFIPFLFGELKVIDLSYFFGYFLLYLLVGIVEELYFRGIIPSVFKKTV